MNGRPNTGCRPRSLARFQISADPISPDVYVRRSWRRTCSLRAGQGARTLANHAFDCIGAKSAGMRTAFINLRQRPFGMTPHQPDLNVSTMTGLADALV